MGDIESEMQQEEQRDGGKDGDKKDTGGIRFGKLKSTKRRELGGVSESEILQLRKAIQALCQATNPLGKCMGHVTDDMDMMSKELDQWKHEARRKEEALDGETKATEESLQELQATLRDVEDQVKEQLGKITSVKANISRNDARINQLLRMV